MGWDLKKNIRTMRAGVADNTVELVRHSGMDRRNPDCRDATNPYHPWSLGSGGPCRNDDETLNSTALGVADADRGL